MRYLLIQHIFFLMIFGTLNAQKLPKEMYFSEDGNQLTRGNRETTGLYNISNIDTIWLEFDQSNYWTQLQNNYESKTEILARLKYRGELYDSVGVRFKGSTSYNSVQGQKKSFSIKMDWMKDNQDLRGYKDINLNNCYEDPSSMREVLYTYLSRKHIPSSKANFVNLMINGENWGLYANIQQLDKAHAGEWFLSDEATRWRAESPSGEGGFGVGPGFGGFFGAGSSSLNDLGEDTLDYLEHYVMKKAYKENPWDDLVKVCIALNNAPSANLIDSLSPYLDIDGALWMLATEIIFTDDDSYVNKGGTDYWVYFDVATGRIVPMEYDGNTALEPNYAGASSGGGGPFGGSTEWGPFYNSQHDIFSLTHVLFNHAELRQRYLTHFRTIISQSVVADEAATLIDLWANKIAPYISASDAKRNYTYQQFQAEVNDLKGFFATRENFLKSNSEVNVQGLTISNVSFSTNGILNERPLEIQRVQVSALVEGTSGVANVYLYYGTGLMGSFEKVQMNGSGTFMATIPAFPKGTFVRYYIEAIANNNAKTATYSPEGAEHDVYIYQVRYADEIESDVVINEIMASNDTTVTDEDGFYGDWIELYNNSSSEIDLTDYTLTDKEATLAEWHFPENTVIAGNSYLIVWADGTDTLKDGNIHANFKLSSKGEIVYLVTPEGNIADSYEFGENKSDIAFARVPNGTGTPVWQGATFGTHNEGLVTISSSLVTEVDRFLVYPNPTNSAFNIQFQDEENHRIQVVNPSGTLIYTNEGNIQQRIDVSNWSAGLYLLRVDEQILKISVY